MLCFPLSSYPVYASWAFLGGVNRRPVFIKVKGSFREKEFCRRFPGETFSNPGIQLPCNRIELLLRVQGEVGSLWQVIAEQSIGVFAHPPLPGRVGMSEVDGDVCCFCQCFVEAHLAALVVRHGKSHLAFKAFEDGAKAFGDRVRPTALLKQRTEWFVPPGCPLETGFPCQ
jgi:hypothetical protein